MQAPLIFHILPYGVFSKIARTRQGIDLRASPDNNRQQERQRGQTGAQRTIREPCYRSTTAAGRRSVQTQVLCRTYTPVDARTLGACINRPSPLPARSLLCVTFQPLSSSLSAFAYFQRGTRMIQAEAAQSCRLVFSLSSACLLLSLFMTAANRNHRARVLAVACFPTLFSYTRCQLFSTILET